MKKDILRKFIVLVNPISGTKAKEAKVRYILTTLQQKNFWAEQATTNAEGDYDWLLQRIVKENITDIIIVGGDGTVNTVMNTLRHASVHIGIIPSGSGNGLAYTAGISKNYKKALDTILHGKPYWIDAFSINDQFACMLSGIGFDAQVAHDFAQQKSRGLVTYTKQSLKNFVRAKPYTFSLTMGTTTQSVEAFFISIANSNQFGNNFTIAPNASLSDGLLDIVIVQKMNKFKLPFAILNQLRGKNKYSQLSETLAQSNIVYLQAETLKINNTEAAPVHIDGEPVATIETMNISIIKNCFQLMMPSTI